VSGRLRDWDAWVTASLQEAGDAQGRTAQREITLRRISGGFERVAEVVSVGAGGWVAWSQEVMQLQRAWGRLGERLRSLMVRVEEPSRRPASGRFAREEPEGRCRAVNQKFSRASGA
jgi:hypothetical protein